MRSVSVTNRFGLALLMLVSLGCRTSSPRPALDGMLSDLHARGLFDGAVVVSDSRGVVFAKGFGFADQARKVPFTPDTATDGASLAKTFTAALLIGMQDDGLLSLDDPAQKFLPELPYRDITLRHLLSHSSGLPVLDYDYFDPFLPKDVVRTTEVLLGALAQQRPALASPPGTAFEYSSFGYDLAALAAARAGGKPYLELLEERFFRPLGMSSPFVRPGRFTDFPAPRTLAYRRSGATSELNDVFDLEAFHGGSNVYVSAKDLDRWNRSFLSAAVLRHEALAAALQFAAIAGSPTALTLGNWYRTADGSAYWYSGHLQGFHNEVFRDVPARRSVVYVSNNTIEPWLQKGLVRAITAVMDGKRVLPLVAPATQTVSKDERPKLAGTWMLPSGEGFVVESAGGHLSAVRDGLRYRIVQIAPNAFYIPGLDPILGFARGTDGTWSRIYVSSNVDEQWGVRAPANAGQ